jgi:pimeloyl-ACP methyl ester carboxylesterase
MRFYRFARVTALFLAVGALVSCSDKVPTPPGQTPSSGVVSSSPPASASPRVAVTWEPCAGKYECARLSVPLDYSGKTPGDIEIAITRLPAADKDRRLGSLVIDPGGPGGSGIEFVQGQPRQFWGQLSERFDIVGFDPRGAGESTPVDCVDDLDALYHADPSPDTAAERDALAEVSRQFARACGEKSGRLLPFISAEPVARDMDEIRKALGEARLTYLGFSYGTYLGAMYAELFPANARALVLDGPVDPTLKAEEWQKQQAVGFEEALQAFLADCAGNKGCAFYSNGAPAAAFDALMAKIDAAPLPVAGGKRVLGPGEASLAVTGALYSRNPGWPRLARGLAAAQKGDGGPLLELSDGYLDRDQAGRYSNSMEIYRAVSCVDLAFPRDLAAYQALAADFVRVAPHFGAELAYEHLDCAFWPVPPAAPRTIRGKGAGPILVVGTTRDPATPYRWAEALSHQLESATLLTREGDGHTAFGSSRCIQSAVETFLVDLKGPPAGTVCK